MQHHGGQGAVDPQPDSRPLDLSERCLEVEAHQETAEGHQQEKAAEELGEPTDRTGRPLEIDPELQVEKRHEEEVDMSRAVERPGAVGHAHQVPEQAIHVLAGLDEEEESSDPDQQVQPAQHRPSADRMM